MPSSHNSKDVLAVITNSGSTNTPGWTLTIHADGSGTLSYEKRDTAQRFHRYEDKTFSAGTFDSKRLASILAEIKDASTIPDHGCLKSVSFGTTTRITFNGKTSGDLSCLSDQDAQIFLDLKHLVQTMSSHI